MLSFKTELKLNNKQRTALEKAAGCYRFAYNTGLAYTLKVLDLKQEFPEAKELTNVASSYSLNKWFNHSVKSEFRWLYESPKDCPQYALVALANAWKKCFKKEGGRPRFQKKGVRDSFSFQQLKFVGSKQIKVPKIGVLRTYERLPNFEPNPLSVATISKDATGRWFISCLIPHEPSVYPNGANSVIGVDVGVKNFATLSTGEFVQVPDEIWQLKTKIARLKRRQSRLVKGSRRYNKYKLSIARLYRKKRNKISNFLHQLTKKLVTNHKVVGIETLSIKGMQKLKRIAPKIQEIGLYEFRRQLEYKAPLYGCELIKADRWFPSSKTCSNCGFVKKDLKLSDRNYKCDCGLSIDRDLNASVNLETLALRGCSSHPKGLVRESAQWFPFDLGNFYKPLLEFSK